MADGGATAYGTVYLVRHGRTPLNAAGLLRGRLDPPLDEVGRAEAEALGAAFAGAQIQAIVSSPLRRAVETATPIAAATGVTLRCDDAFLDRDYGRWAGHEIAEVEAQHGSLDAAPEIESLDALANRATTALEGLAAAGTSTVVVAHDIVNRTLLARLCADTADDPADVPQRTGCWNRIDHVDRRLRATVVDALPGDGRRPG